MSQSGKKKRLQRDLPTACVTGTLWKERASVSQLKEAQQIIATCQISITWHNFSITNWIDKTQEFCFPKHILDLESKKEPHFAPQKSDPWKGKEVLRKGVDLRLRNTNLSIILPWKSLRWARSKAYTFIFLPPVTLSPLQVKTLALAIKVKKTLFSKKKTLTWN